MLEFVPGFEHIVIPRVVIYFLVRRRNLCLRGRILSNSPCMHCSFASDDTSYSKSLRDMFYNSKI